MTIFLDGLLAFTETTGRRRKRSVVAAQAGPAMYGALTSRISVMLGSAVRNMFVYVVLAVDIDFGAA